jgi:alpha-beta hydrolase superfamily lysophospholipase
MATDLRTSGVGSRCASVGRDVGRRTILAAAVAAVVCASGAAAATPQEVTIQASDGVSLACGLVEPDGAPPVGGWPGLLLFHGLGGTHAEMEAAATAAFAPAGFASLACDARGEGASGGAFGLDGRRDVQDVRELFTWLAARPEVSDTEIGAVGLSLGGGLVWNAAAAGVPFKAIVPAITWTNLAAALAPRGIPRTGLLAFLAQQVPLDRWDPELAAARDALLGGTDTSAVTALARVRSVAGALPRLDVPTLLVQGRHDFLFDIDQALAAYRQLQGPKELYLGDLGHPPALNPLAEVPTYLGLVVAWLDRYVRGNPSPATPGVVLAHDPWDGRTTSYPGLPPLRKTSVALPGSATLQPGGHVARRVRLTGGRHETFGGGTVVVRYSGAKNWPVLVASVAVAGTGAPVTVGAARIAKPEGAVTIHLLDESVLLPAGQRLVVTVGATSAAGLYTREPPAGATITIGRETLKLSLLARPVSG